MLDVENNRYEWLVEFKFLRNVNAVISSGSDLKTTIEANDVVGNAEF